VTCPGGSRGAATGAPWRSRDRVEDRHRGPGDSPTLQFRVVLDAHPGECGDLAAAQAGHATVAHLGQADPPRVVGLTLGEHRAPGQRRAAGEPRHGCSRAEHAVPQLARHGDSLGSRCRDQDLDVHGAGRGEPSPCIIAIRAPSQSIVPPRSNPRNAATYSRTSAQRRGLCPTPSREVRTDPTATATRSAPTIPTSPATAAAFVITCRLRRSACHQIIRPASTGIGPR
jgi:hypothetical protein